MARPLRPRGRQPPQLQTAGPGGASAHDLPTCLAPGGRLGHLRGAGGAWGPGRRPGVPPPRPPLGRHGLSARAGGAGPVALAVVGLLLLGRPGGMVSRSTKATS